MNWDAVTRGWVADGLISEPQREPLRAWLDEHAPANPFGAVILTALVSGGCWLLTGSLALSVDLAGFDGDGPALAALVAGLAQAILGVGARIGLGRPVAQGLWTAAVPITVFSLTALWDAPWKDAALIWLLPTLLPVGVGTAVAVVDRMPGLAAASAFAALVPLGLEVFAYSDPVASAVAAACLALTWAFAVGALLRPQTEALQPQVPFWTTLAMTGIGVEGSAWESGALLALYGTLALGAAAVGRSRWTLVSGVGALICAEVVLLGAVGDMMIATVVLGIEGLALMAGAFVYLAWQVGKRRKAETDRRPRASTGGDAPER